MGNDERYRLYRRSYKDRDGVKRETDNLYIDFWDHANIIHRWPLRGSQSACEEIADRLMELVDLRQRMAEPTPELFKWLESLDGELRARIVKAELIDPSYAVSNVTLAQHLEGYKALDGIEHPGFKDTLIHRGNTREHANQTVMRARRIIDDCGFIMWRDMCKPGTKERIVKALHGIKTKDGIGTKTASYYLRDFKSFCRWMADGGKVSHNPFEKMKGLPHEGESDEDKRRAFTVDEMRELLATTLADGVQRYGMTAEDRVFLYHFAYETGIRPKQIRALTAKNFRLDGDPPVVITQARHVKRRVSHEQVLTQRMADLLKSRLSTKMPDAPLFSKLAPRNRLAVMIREDMEAARKKWIEAAGGTDAQLKRQRSDFLAPENQQGEKADFYSLRHTHGQTLGDAGVSQKDIAASLHHARTSTTDRYTKRTTAQAQQRTISTLPDVLPIRLRRTGTDDAATTPTPSTTAPTPIASQPQENQGQASGDDATGEVSDNPNVCAGAAQNGRNSTELDGTETPSIMQKTQAEYPSGLRERIANP